MRFRQKFQNKMLTICVLHYFVEHFCLLLPNAWSVLDTGVFVHVFMCLCVYVFMVCPRHLCFVFMCVGVCGYLFISRDQTKEILE